MILKPIDLNSIRVVAEEAAKEAGAYIQTQFGRDYVKQEKIGGDSLASQIVTEVDRNAQEMILNHLKQSFKQYDLGLLTEESDDDHSRLTKDHFWCIDPLDGTLPFSENRTGYAVSIALISKAGDPVVAAVYIPDKEDIYTAIKGQGVLKNGKELKVKADKSMFHVYWDQSFRQEEHFQYVVDQLSEYALGTRQIITYQMNYGGVRNAIEALESGNGCYFKFPKSRRGGGSIWDYAATRLFYEEANAYVSNAHGKTLNLNDPESTFLNEQGIIYASNLEAATFISGLEKRVRKRFSL